MATSLQIPSIVRRVDSNLKTIISSSWARRNQYNWWRRVVKTRGSTTGIEYLQWLLETARIRDLGKGGRNIFSDQMAVNFSIENENFGDSLTLTSNQMLDALGSQANTNNALDIAAQWGRQIGNQGAYWPQLQAAQFLTGATTVTAYDGLPFFSTAHWVNPATKAGSTFANIFYGVPFTTAGYAAVGAYIRSIKAPDGIARKIEPRIVLTGESDAFAAKQMFGAESLIMTDPLNPNGASPATNITKTLYRTEAPISDPDLNMTGDYQGSWWIACELQEDEELGGMIFQEREPFRLNSYSELDDVVLGRADAFEWKFKGRNAFSAGHPFLLFQCVPKVPSGKSQFAFGSFPS